MWLFTKRAFSQLILGSILVQSVFAQKTVRELGLSPGILPIGQYNAITDVPGVRVGHVTIVKGDSICTGVTAIIPHDGNLFQSKVPAAIYIANGFGKLAGSSQVQELGNLETPIILTNTLSVSTAMEALISYTLNHKGNETVKSVNALVGETNDGYLNDIRGRHVVIQDVLDAISSATDGVVAQGSVGAGTGTIAFGYKGGIGSSSRKLPDQLGGHTVGVLVQANFGGVLQVDGVPVGETLGIHPFREALPQSDGSCMIIVATDAPLDARNLQRLAKRAMLGLARTGGFASNGSGDYVIAFSTFVENRVPYNSPLSLQIETLSNDAMSPLFLAVVESTEEAILNALFMADVPSGYEGQKIRLLPTEKILPIMRKFGRLD